MPIRRKSNSNFVADKPKQGWAYFEETGQWRRTPDPWGAPRDHYPREYGDWFAVSKPKSWQPPAGTLAGESLLDGGAGLMMTAPEGGAGLPADGGHTKTGAGHKPQGYDAHGRYTGPQGGAISTDGGPVRLFANAADGEPGAGDDDEAGFEGSAAGDEAAEGEVILAEEGDDTEGDSTPTVEQASYEEGGLSGGTEVRGPVLPPEKAPAVVTWRNDEPNREPTHQDLEQKTRDTVENLRKDNPELGSINVNSGKRDGETGPHGEGRAVDINYVNGAHVRDVMLGNDAVAKEQLQQQSAAVEAWGRKEENIDVEMVITPFGGFYRNPDTGKVRDATSAEIAAHWNHIHIQTRK